MGYRKKIFGKNTLNSNMGQALIPFFCCYCFCRVSKCQLWHIDDQYFRLDEIVSTRDVENHAKQQENSKIDAKPTETLEPDKSRIAKLIEERDILLQTGVYSLDDRVITELDKEIQNLILQNVLQWQYYQGRIQRRSKQLRWGFLRKQLTALTC